MGISGNEVKVSGFGGETEGADEALLQCYAIIFHQDAEKAIKDGKIRVELIEGFSFNLQNNGVFQRFDIHFGGLFFVKAAHVDNPTVFNRELKVVLLAIRIDDVDTEAAFNDKGIPGRKLSGLKQKLAFTISPLDKTIRDRLFFDRIQWLEQKPVYVLYQCIVHCFENNYSPD